MSFLSDLKICQHFYGSGRPVMVDIHPTLACQNKCYYCISANTHISGKEHENFSRRHSLDWTALQKAIADMKDMGVKSVQLTGGGEPSLYGNFSDLLSALRPMKVGLITNGIVLSEYATEVNLFTDWVRFSLDASNKRMYQQIKGADHYEEVMESITRVLDCRKGKKPRVGVAYIITPESMKGVEDVILELQTLQQRCQGHGAGIDYLQFKDVVQRGMMLTHEYRQRVEMAIERMRREVKFPIIYTHHAGVHDIDLRGTCEVLDYVAVLGADGEVYGCCHLEYMKETSYGSIYSKPFSQIWRDRGLIEIDEDKCWNCRFTHVNQVIANLKGISDGDFL